MIADEGGSNPSSIREKSVAENRIDSTLNSD
jgi:hypothetical protein